MRALIIILIGLGILTSSCEDVIDVQLQEGETALVVDGWLNNLDQQQVITLSLSQPYFEDDDKGYINDATVLLSSSTGETFTFSAIGDGRYAYDPAETLGGLGDRLTLSIDYDGHNYSAVSEIRRVPPIDSISMELRENEIGFDDGLYANFFSRDPVGQGDTYWIKTYKNGAYLDDPLELNIAYDAAFDPGSQVDGLIFITPIRDLINEANEDDLISPYIPGDSIRVELHAISNAAFDFLDIAREQITNGNNGIFSLPLANTQSNVTSTDGGLDVLGFFDVANVSELTYVVPE